MRVKRPASAHCGACPTRRGRDEGVVRAARSSRVGPRVDGRVQGDACRVLLGVAGGECQVRTRGAHFVRRATGRRVGSAPPPVRHAVLDAELVLIDETGRVTSTQRCEGHQSQPRSAARAASTGAVCETGRALWLSPRARELSRWRSSGTSHPPACAGGMPGASMAEDRRARCGRVRRWCKCLSRHPDLNRGPTDYESVALPAELCRPMRRGRLSNIAARGRQSPRPAAHQGEAASQSMTPSSPR